MNGTMGRGGVGGGGGFPFRVKHRHSRTAVKQEEQTTSGGLSALDTGAFGKLKLNEVRLQVQQLQLWSIGMASAPPPSPPPLPPSSFLSLQAEQQPDQVHVKALKGTTCCSQVSQSTGW